RPLGYLVRRRRGARRAAETAIAAAERRLRDGGDQLAGRLVAYLAFVEDERAFAGTLVDHLDDPRMADDGALGLKRLVQRKTLLAVDDAQLIDAGLTRPGHAVAEHGRHGGEHFEI